MSLSLNLLVAKSILRPINDMIAMARKVRKGYFHQKVRVVSNDELGIMGDGMNAMTDGLIERDRLRRGLYLAQEIQQALLPRTCPIMDGLDIAARSLYCDETGGDYYDFIGNDNKTTQCCHWRCIRPWYFICDPDGFGSRFPSATVSPARESESDDVRCQPPTGTDVEDSGNFMTLFYLRLDPAKRCVSWIRAGHDPAIFYDPFRDASMKCTEKVRHWGLLDRLYLKKMKEPD